MSLSQGKRLKAAVIGEIAWPVVEALSATWRWHEVGREHLSPSALGGRQPIVAFWHGRILASILYHRDKRMVALVSENFDGEWITRVIRRFGFRTARGSTTRGGARALVQLRRDLDLGLPVAVTVDGPVGPAREAQPGAVWLAGATGHPVVPFHIEASD